MLHSRRRLLSLGVSAGGALLTGAATPRLALATPEPEFGAPEPFFGPRDFPPAAAAPAVDAAPASAAARSLVIHSVNTGERLSATYFEGGAYVPDAVQALNHIMRDRRSGDVFAMDRGLFDLVHALGDKLETSRPVELICGYRSPATNARRAAESGEVAKHSLHMDGLAVDLRFDGVDLAYLRKAAQSLALGGVGYYPRSNFVHVDIGRVRTWEGT